MREDIEDIFMPDDLDLYRRYWEARADASAPVPDMDEEDYGVVVSICIMEQAYDKAEQVLEEALGRYPHDDELLFSKVEMLASTERLDEAFKVLDEIEAWYPNNEECLAMRAGLYMSQERYEEAEELFRRYEAVGGDPGVVAAGLAQCLAVRGQRLEGFRKICRYLKLEPSSVDVCNRFIVWAIEWEMLEEAAAELRKMTADQPYNKHLWKLLYEVCEMLEDYEGAKEANEYTLAIDPDDYEGHGRRILYSDMCDAALVEDSIGRFNPEKWTATQRFYFYGVMADYYAERHQPEREMFYIRELLKEPLEAQDKATLNYRLATRLFTADDAAAQREALFHFRKAEQAIQAVEHPNVMLVSDIRRGIGQCLLSSGEEQEGLAALREAWRLAPANDVATFDYFMNLCVVNDLDKALADIETGLSEEPHNSRYKLLKGVILLKMCKSKQAETWFKAAFLSNPDMITEAEEAIPDIMADPVVRNVLADLAE